MKTKTAFDISLGLISDPVNGQKIKPNVRFVMFEEVQKENKRIYEEGVNALFDKQIEIQDLIEKAQKLEAENKQLWKIYQSQTIDYNALVDRKNILYKWKEEAKLAGEDISV